jgi:hypothetical protein
MLQDVDSIQGKIWKMQRPQESKFQNKNSSGIESGQCSEAEWTWEVGSNEGFEDPFLKDW